ncbi:MAG: NAD-dependent malic enzyme [Acetobacteraceae bacterium]|nr:NAD-dependent malic enzyme [Acetobacteraceae bacterium]MBV8573873.1 NAD-dependent malic enzyme [Acetobacteraceae bacterium]
MAASNTRTGKRGIDVLHDPTINKSTGFTEAERQALGLIGLVPDVTETIETQLARVLLQLKEKPSDLERFIHLMNLLETDRTLFYRTLASDPARFLEIVYDPEIGEASLKFDRIFRRSLGMYLSISRKGHVKEVLRNWPVKDVRFICATNGGRILGLGDLGANGMAIPIGKLQLYTAAAGVPPEGQLPMYLDAGTNNETNLHDPFYLGLRQHRPSTEELYAFVDEFVDAVQEVFPNCCIHFEDWTGTDAIALLARYRNKVCCYNDDIQGTGGVTLAGVINSLKITGGQLKDQRVLFLGAGSAAIGLADLIVAGMGEQGVKPEAGRQRIRMFDTQGLVVAGRPGLAAGKLPYAHNLPPSKPFDHLDPTSECPQIVAAIEDFKPTILIGVSGKALPAGVGRLFSREVVEAMSRLNARPIIFALSNPVEHHECLPEQAYAWSGGKAIYAGGVQFPPVHIGGQTYLPSQANNLYVFPAVGMAIYATKARRVTDAMFIESAHAVADQVTPEQLKLGMLFPPQSNILEVEIQTAARVAKLVFDADLARVDRPADMVSFIRRHVYKPEYPVEAAAAAKTA